MITISNDSSDVCFDCICVDHIVPIMIPISLALFIKRIAK
jgi:hypothetical protein